VSGRFDVGFWVSVAPGWAAEHGTGIYVDVIGDNRSGVGDARILVANVVDPISVTSSRGTIASTMANSQGYVRRVNAGGQITVTDTTNTFTRGTTLYFRLDAFSGRNHNQDAAIDAADVYVLNANESSLTLERPRISRDGVLSVVVATPARSGEPAPIIVVDNILITGTLNESETYNVDVFVARHDYNWDNPERFHGSATGNAGFLNEDFLDSGDFRELFYGTFETTYSAALFTFGAGLPGTPGGPVLLPRTISSTTPFYYFDANNTFYTVEAPFMNIEGNGYVALRALAGIFNWNLGWVQATSTAVFANPNGTFNMSVSMGDPFAVVNGEYQMMLSGLGEALFMLNENGRTYLPVRFLNTVLGYEAVVWNANNTLTITP
jgi:hypothetical protein